MKTAGGRDEIFRYLNEHGVQDKDAAHCTGQSAKAKTGIGRNRKGVPRKVIDLHGMVSDDAQFTLAKAMEECKRIGIKELLVIHGRGTHSDASEEGVLKKLVRDNLEFRYSTAIRGYSSAPPRDGGEGATLVWMK